MISCQRLNPYFFNFTRGQSRVGTIWLLAVYMRQICKYVYNQPLNQFDIKNEKQLAQIDSAKRSLLTNLIFIFVFFAVSFLVFWLPVEARNYVCVFFYTLIKGLMPLLSTVANFGTIQTVFLQYKEHFSQLYVIKLICKTWMV